jgi:hypothetical protein
MQIPFARPRCNALVLFALPFEFYIVCVPPFLSSPRTFTTLFSAFVGLRLQRSMLFVTCSTVHAIHVGEHIAESWKLKLQSPGM